MLQISLATLVTGLKEYIFVICYQNPLMADKVIARTRNKSNDYFESMQYRQDVCVTLPIITTEKNSLAIHVVQKITIIRVQKIGKFAVSNLILYTGAIWRRREKFEHGCTTIYHPL